MEKSFIKKILFTLVVTSIIGLPLPVSANDGGKNVELFISPPSGNYIVGETFDMSIYVDTGGHSINAVDVNLRFPADKLQVISPSVGKSIIGIWTATPSFNNLTGGIRFQGGIPSPGIETSRGLISTVSFRVKSVGTAHVIFSGDSKVLLNDGLGTNALTNTRGAAYSSSLPAPAGPTVESFTHPDQSRWYKNSTVGLEWTNNFPVQGYSYSLSKNPIEESDDISEGNETSVSYKNLADGFYYFHIKALRNGVWGGTTHYALKIDSTAPAEFPIQILTGNRSANRNPVIDFQTTDEVSGINRYELKIVPLSLLGRGGTFAEKNEEGFFLEVANRYIPDNQLELGEYDIIVRAFDNAGNFRESTQRLSVITPFINFTNSGVVLLDKLLIPWFVIIVALLGLLVLIIIILRIAIKSHKHVNLHHVSGVLEDPIIKKRLEELERRRKKHLDLRKRHAGFLLAFALTAGLFGNPVQAQEGTAIPPPIIGTVSDSISDDELFYISGRSDVSDSEVIIYIQNLQDNQLITGTVTTDKKGDWFYAHESPLIKGSYSVWSQQKIGNQLSPPSPQRKVSVSNTAIQIGASRLSYETMYLFTTIILLIITILLGLYTAYHFFEGRRKYGNIKREIKEVDNSIRDGFIRLRRDIQEEIEIVNQAKLNKTLTKAHEKKEAELKISLKEIEEYIKDEFRDVKRQFKSIKY